MKNFSFFVIFFSFLLNFNANAQEQTLFESEGTDFWLTFMPNYHNNFRSPDSLYIFITSKTPTKGTIYYNEHRNNTNFPREHSFEITQPNQIYKFSVHNRYFALEGFNRGAQNNNNTSLENTDCEIINRKTFHIVTENKSTVYALDYADMSAEAFIVLPIPALGKEYFVMSYNSDGRLNWFALDIVASTPSQFAIVAVNDSTNIAISPTVSTARFGIDEQNITLNKGEVYFVQAKITTDSLRNDLSGTHIVADKEIAVFAGHQRATLPVDAANGNSNPSRDNLIEQLIPVHSWGKNAIITPFSKSTNENNNNDFADIFRVIAAKDETTVTVKGNTVETFTLNAGEYWSGTLEPALITADKPIMVTQYKRNETFNGNSDNSIYYSDPLMLIVPPIEQYKPDYNVINPTIEINRRNIFTNQFLTIVAPDTSTDKVYLDNSLLSANLFTSIPNSGYSFAHIKTTAGGHNIICKDPISVQVYGYGSAVSYGYLGGMSFKDLEKEKIAMLVDTCFMNATFEYNEVYNSGIKSYEILENYNCDLSETARNQWQLKLNIEKNFPEQIAYFSIKITDLYDIDTVFSDTMSVNMFTVSGVSDDLNVDFADCTISSLNSKGFYVKNTGLEDLELNSKDFLMYQNENFTLGKSVFPIKLKPQDSVFVEIYYAPTVAKNRVKARDYDTLLISNLCNHYILTFAGTPIADTFDLDSRCDVPIRFVADSVDLEYWVPQIFPNPVENSTVKYKFSISSETIVDIRIYNFLGELVDVIISDYLAAGSYEIEINTSELSVGNYFINLSTQYNNSNTNLLIINQ